MPQILIAHAPPGVPEIDAKRPANGDDATEAQAFGTVLIAQLAVPVAPPSPNGEPVPAVSGKEEAAKTNKLADWSTLLAQTDTPDKRKTGMPKPDAVAAGEVHAQFVPLLETQAARALAGAAQKTLEPTLAGAAKPAVAAAQAKSEPIALPGNAPVQNADAETNATARSTASEATASKAATNEVATSKPSALAVTDAVNASAGPHRRETRETDVPPQLVAGSHAPPEASSTKDTTRPAIELRTPMANPTWPDELGQKLHLLLNSRTQSAELHVHPSELGPISVHIRVDGDHATLFFVATHADTQMALQSALPKLKEMFADAGIGLGQTTISGEFLPQQSFAGGDRGGGQTYRPAAEIFAVEAAALTQQGALPVAAQRTRGDGSIDTFA